MKLAVKEIDSIDVTDLLRNPVWEYTNSHSSETAVRPVLNTPADNLSGRIVGTQVCLANGEREWAIIGNVIENKPNLTQHFLTLSILRNGRWFTLARYFDFNYKTNGPEGLSRFLEKGLDDIFPISYDLTPFAIGVEAALRGTITKEPRQKLAQSEIIALAIERGASRKSGN